MATSTGKKTYYQKTGRTIPEAWNQAAAKWNLYWKITVFLDLSINSNTCQHQFWGLLENFKNEDMEHFKASGTEAEYKERVDLLRDIISVIGAVHLKIQHEKEAKKEDEKVKKLRDLQMAALKIIKTSADKKSDTRYLSGLTINQSLQQNAKKVIKIFAGHSGDPELISKNFRSWCQCQKKKTIISK